MTRYFLHDTGQLATITDSGSCAASGPVPFDPSSIQRDGWTEVDEGRYIGQTLELQAEAEAEHAVMVEWHAKVMAARRDARLQALRGADHEYADELLLDEPVPLVALGLKPPDPGPAARRMAAMVAAAEKIAKRKAPKRPTTA